MSVYSMRNSKAPSVAGSQSGGQALHYETLSTVSRAARTPSGPKSTNTLPIHAVTIPSSSTKERVLGDQEMTEEEIEHLADVCRRCELLQRQEDERIRNIRDKAIAKVKSVHGISTYDDEHCAICSANFVSVLNPKSTCTQCERFVCRNCVQRRFDGDRVICKSCFSECTNKARTGLWFTEKLQIAKKSGRVIQLAPTSALRASLIRKKREQSSASSMIGTPGNGQQPTGTANDPVYEAARRLANNVDGGTSNSVFSGPNALPPIIDKRRRTSSASSVASSKRSIAPRPTIQDGRRRSMRASSESKPPLPKNIAPAATNPPGSIGDQLAFNMIFSGVDDLPKTLPRTRSRQHSSSGTMSPTMNAGNSNTPFDGNNWDSRSMVSGVSVGSVTSVYSEREESFTHGIGVTGDISFSVDFDEKSGSLRVYVKQCRQVAVANDKTGQSDTYVKTYLLPDKTKTSKRKTRVKKATINPIFNEPLIYNIAKSDLAYRTLQISLWHHRHMKANLFLGEVLVPLADYRFSSTPIWRALQDRVSSTTQFAHQLTKGQLVVGLKFVPSQTSEEGELHVYLKGAIDLNIPVGESIGSAALNLVDAYAKTYLLPDRSQTSKRKTKVVKKTNNPNWEETVVYTGILKTQLPSIGVQIIVWDAGHMKRNEYLGGCNLNTGSRTGYGMDATGIERSLWVDMMSKPNTMAESTINLRSTMD